MNPCHVTETFLSSVCSHGVRLPKGIGALIRFGHRQTQVVLKGNQGSSSCRVAVGFSNRFTHILGYDSILTITAKMKLVKKISKY